MTTTKLPEPRLVFRVHIWKSSLYVRVYVWKTKKDLLAFRKYCHMRGTCDAFVIAVQKRVGRSNHLSPLVGQMHFALHNVRQEIITHECFHAVCLALRRLKFNFARLADPSGHKLFSEEEVLAYALGKLARHVVNRFHAEGFYK